MRLNLRHELAFATVTLVHRGVSMVVRDVLVDTGAASTVVNADVEMDYGISMGGILGMDYLRIDADGLLHLDALAASRRSTTSHASPPPRCDRSGRPIGVAADRIGADRIGSTSVRPRACRARDGARHLTHQSATRVWKRQPSDTWRTRPPALSPMPGATAPRYDAPT